MRECGFYGIISERNGIISERNDPISVPKWDHFGTVKRGDKRHLVTMPYVHLERANVLEFAKLIGAALVSEDAQRGFWSPNSYYYEFAPIGPT